VHRLKFRDISGLNIKHTLLDNSLSSTTFINFNFIEFDIFQYNDHFNCLLKEVIEGKIKERIEVTRRRGRRRKQLLDDLGDRRGYSNLEEALDRIKWRNRFGRGCGPVV
jgi:hypothetical protein